MLTSAGDRTAVASAGSIPQSPTAPDAWTPSSWRGREADQQPAWPDPVALWQMTQRLRMLPPLVLPHEVQDLRTAMGEVASGRALLLQAGDCAESFRDGADDIRTRVHLLRDLAVILSDGANLPVVTTGRMAGQFAKPRSRDTEAIAGRVLPAFKGHLIHDDEATPAGRIPDPRRLLWGYSRARSTLELLTEPAYARRGGRRDLWSCHEALLLPYEESLVRPDPITGGWYGASAHMLWVGDRTRHPTRAHIAFLSGLTNPIGCKLGPTATPAEVVEICDRLDPHRRPGRLTLITRLGAARITELLPPLVEAVRAAAHPVSWVCDPMHGNTRITAAGLKYRLTDDMLEEACGFVDVHRRLGTHPGGLHLEVTAEDVIECAADESVLDSSSYRSLCDPRLNPAQSAHLVGEVARLLRPTDPGSRPTSALSHSR
jgi:3-deoxy-7-phosphoheptulonate synthase